MNRDHIQRLLDNPQQIDAVADLPLLNELVSAFPYFGASHSLLAKALFEGNSIYSEQFIRKAAIYTGNRAHLYQLLFPQVASHEVSTTTFDTVESLELQIAAQSEKDAKTAAEEELFAHSEHSEQVEHEDAVEAQIQRQILESDVETPVDEPADLGIESVRQESTYMHDSASELTEDEVPSVVDSLEPDPGTTELYLEAKEPTPDTDIDPQDQPATEETPIGDEANEAPEVKEPSTEPIGSSAQPILMDVPTGSVTALFDSEINAVAPDEISLGDYLSLQNNISDSQPLHDIAPSHNIVWEELTNDLSSQAATFGEPLDTTANDYEQLAPENTEASAQPFSNLDTAINPDNLQRPEPDPLYSVDYFSFIDKPDPAPVQQHAEVQRPMQELTATAYNAPQTESTNSRPFIEWLNYYGLPLQRQISATWPTITSSLKSVNTITGSATQEGDANPNIQPNEVPTPAPAQQPSPSQPLAPPQPATPQEPSTPSPSPTPAPAPVPSTPSPAPSALSIGSSPSPATNPSQTEEHPEFSDIVIAPPTPKPTGSEAQAIIEQFIAKDPVISRPKAEFFNPVNMANKSATPAPSFATETLANIYAAQGDKDKAIQIFETLSKRHPEKSAYFAVRISELNQ